MRPRMEFLSRSPGCAPFGHARRTPLTPAATDELEQTFAHVLRFDGRKRIHRGDEFMARLMAEHLAKRLAASGFVVMKKPPAPMHSSEGVRTK
jgi:hypothetical protein